MLLKDKTAIITGCNRGIGKEILRSFSRNGASVLACVRKIDQNFKNLINDITKETSNTIFPFQFDLISEEEILKAATSILSENKKIDILVNNAATIHTASYLMTSKKKLKEIFEINFFSQCSFTQLISKSMIKNKSGSIINISSISAEYGNEGRAAYSASKAAFVAYSKVLSRELGQFNVRVNTISPGLIDTEMLKNNTSDKIIADITKQISLGKIGLPSQVANAAIFLASDLSEYITGQTLRVDGGM
jgi:3-oxoacyl-[acyl-carrier protein] reductase